MTDLYLSTSLTLARQLTEAYSTSFSLSVGLIDRKLRPAVYAVYGMVRLADEIVDTPVPNAAAVLKQFQADLEQAVQAGYSSNPVLHAFQWAFTRYGLSQPAVDAFFQSMEMDLHPQTFDQNRYQQYVHGSAEVIGLLCLPIFCADYTGLANELAAGASKLGAAYQKINFLRDIGADYRERSRSYFPGVVPGTLSEQEKREIESEILSDLEEGQRSLNRLPYQARRGVRLSFLFYRHLLHILSQLPAEEIYRHRARVSGLLKFWIYLRAVTNL